MKVTVDMENLSELIEKAANENMQDAINAAMEKVVRQKVDECLKEQSENAINDIIHGMVEKYIAETKVTVGNSWDEEGVNEYTLEQYLKLKIKNIFEKQVFTVVEHDSWRGRDTRTEVSFKDYIDKQMDVEAEIKKNMNRFADSVKSQVNRRIKDTLDESMKSALTDNIFAMLSSSQTYQTVARNVQLLGE